MAGHEASADSHMEVAMSAKRNPTPARVAILTLAEIKAAVGAFDRGEKNAFDVLDAVLVAVEAWRAAARPRRRAA